MTPIVWLAIAVAALAVNNAILLGIVWSLGRQLDRGRRAVVQCARPHWTPWAPGEWTAAQDLGVPAPEGRR